MILAHSTRRKLIASHWKIYILFPHRRTRRVRCDFADALLKGDEWFNACNRRSALNHVNCAHRYIQTAERRERERKNESSLGKSQSMVIDTQTPKHSRLNIPESATISFIYLTQSERYSDCVHWCIGIKIHFRDVLNWSWKCQHRIKVSKRKLIWY